jgi:DNA polymerase-3 subunit gamma/tau
MSYANGLSPFRGAVKGFLIPNKHFKNAATALSVTKSAIVADPPAPYTTRKETPSDPLPKTLTPPQAPPRKISIDKPELSNRISNLSLSSIKLKKEAASKSLSKQNIMPEAEDPFTLEKLLEQWKAYIQEKKQKGENNIAALLEMSSPELLPQYKLLLKTTNSLSKKELTKELPTLLAQLSKALNNYKIKFDILVEEQKSEEYVYGIKEKYEYLKKINPEIEVLHKEFGLDL